MNRGRASLNHSEDYHAPAFDRASRPKPRAAPGLRRYAYRHREEFPGLQYHRQGWRPHGAVESVAARAEVRKADLGADQSALLLAFVPKPVREVAILVTGAKFRA